MGLDGDGEEETNDEVQVAAVKQAPQVPPQLLVAPKVKTVATTQRERFYLHRIRSRNQKEEVAKNIVAEQDAKRSLKPIR